MVVFNNQQEEVAYLRFSMGNPGALLVYELLDAEDFNGGVSGIGSSLTISLSKMEEALKIYQSLWNEEDLHKMNDFSKSLHKEIQQFLTQCVETAIKEKKVEVTFC